MAIPWINTTKGVSASRPNGNRREGPDVDSEDARREIHESIRPILMYVPSNTMIRVPLRIPKVRAPADRIVDTEIDTRRRRRSARACTLREYTAATSEPPNRAKRPLKALALQK